MVLQIAVDFKLDIKAKQFIRRYLNLKLCMISEAKWTASVKIAPNCYLGKNEP